MKIPPSITWYLHRLRAMGPGEVAQRLHEKWLQKTEPAFLESLKELRFNVTPLTSPPLPKKEHVPVDLRLRLAEDATRLKAGHWRLFGWRELEMGAPPCWHRDPCSGVVIPPGVPSRKLNHRQLPDGADARTIWELNRWAEMTRLAMHAWVNDDIDALRTAQSWLQDWAEKNPPGYGINWTSPLEAAIRLINLTWFDALVVAALEGHPDWKIRQTQAELVQKLVPVHAAWVWRYRSGGSSANNHLLGELSAVAIATSRWPSLAALACSANEAWVTLESELLRQFAPDGGSREQALHYHLFAFELAWLAAHSVACSSGPGYERLCKAAVFFASVAHGEEPWDFGDNDDAQVLPLTGKRTRAVAEWKGWVEGVDGPLHFWLGPPPLFAPRPAKSTTTIYPDSGLAVIRQEGWLLRLDASPLGLGSLAAHGHADALHLSIWDGGEALLIDPGTGGYYGYPQWRAPLAAWESHNGPVPASGFKTPARMGPFLWTRHHETPQLTQSASGAQVSLAHEGFVFTRSVSIVDGRILIFDEEAGGQVFKVRLILAPECRLFEENQGHYRVERGGRVWRIQTTQEQCILTSGEVMVSSSYGAVKMAPSLDATALRGKLSVEWRRIA